MNKLFYQSMLALLVTAVFASNGFSHGKKEHSDVEIPEYDATSTEFGSYDPALKPDQTINISMADTMRFSPSHLTIEAGDIVKFEVTNDGKLLHEFVLGTNNTLTEHAALMIKFPNMEHEEPYMAHVAPGEKMEIIWQFSNAGSYEYGCLLPGHFDAGMKGTIVVN